MTDALQQQVSLRFYQDILARAGVLERSAQDPAQAAPQTSPKAASRTAARTAPQSVSQTQSQKPVQTPPQAASQTPARTASLSVPQAQPQVAVDLPISYVTDDSRNVRPQTLFVCKGAAFRREYLLQAIEAGAVAYVSERDYDVEIPFVQVNDIRATLGLLADAAYDHPSGKVGVCAFTGTKGKTTSVYYLRGMLSAQARRSHRHEPAFLTGVEYDDGVEQGGSKLTTPESFELERRIANAASSGCNQLVMEASSQALKYRRTLGVDFEVGAFTNFGEDHISPIEHPTMEDYFASKTMLFNSCRTAVVNLDMDVSERVLEAAHAAGCERVLTYSLCTLDADVTVLAYERRENVIVARVRTPRFTDEFTIPSPAKFNLVNALGAIACAEALGVSAQDMREGLAAAHVPGRMELYPGPSGRIVGIVDYAHNGMSLETLLRDLRDSYPGREIAVVFGATGGKGVDRRETMGVAAGKLADRIVITEDDPGPEDPADIARAIADAVERQGNHAWQIVLDRSEAIQTAVRETEGRAVVVVTGKGNDPFMLRHGVREPYEPDGDQLQRALAEWNG